MGWVPNLTCTIPREALKRMFEDNTKIHMMHYYYLPAIDDTITSKATLHNYEFKMHNNAHLKRDGGYATAKLVVP